MLSNRTISSFIVLLIAAYVLLLAFGGNLDVYIHPRYITFTISMAAIGFLLALINVAVASTVNDKGLESLRTLAWLPLLLVIGMAFIFPARSLTSATVSQRSLDTQNAAIGLDAAPITDLFAQSSLGLGVSDWSRLLATNDDPSFYATKQAKVSGFIYDADLGNNTLWLARFIVTCCAVDAQPVGIPVQIVDWRNAYTEDQWLEVEGVFELAQTSQGEQLVLVPKSTIVIDEPDNPYAN